MLLWSHSGSLLRNVAQEGFQSERCSTLAVDYPTRQLRQPPIRPMVSKLKGFWLGLLGLLLVLNACVISPRRDGVNNGGNGNGNGNGAFGRIYVTNTSAPSIVRFDNALTVSGNTTPGATISGGATLLSSPGYLFLDTVNNRLFVANQGGSNILVFDNANTQAGNVAPTRTISGPATQLFSPVDVALDRTRDLLYVADGTAIQVFATGSSASGNVTPLHTLSLG